MNAKVELDSAPLIQKQHHESQFISWDGTKICFRAWLPKGTAKSALILFHRGHEHSGRFEEMARLIDLNQTAIFAWDQRGHGASPGTRGAAPNFCALIKDTDCFVRYISHQYSIPLENIVVLGHSVGAVIAAAWVHDYAPRIAGMILGTPAFRVKLYVPFAIPLLRLLLKLKPKSFIKSYVRSTMLTHDPIQAHCYDTDSNISRNIAVNVLLDLHDVSTRLIQDAGAIRIPTLILAAGSDWVVKSGPQRKFFARLSSDRKQIVIYKGFHHAIFHEADRKLPIAEARRFCLERFNTTEHPKTLIEGDKTGFTRQEFEQLSRKLPPFGLKQAQFLISRTLMSTLGLLSTGIRLGWRTGFDSGESLDYVYRNEPEGITPLGRHLDRQYLNSIGWRGIRKRKVHLKQQVNLAISRLRAANQPIRLVDIASGPGRYLLEILKERDGEDISAIMRDRSKTGLEAGRLLAREMGLSNATFSEGDAFDPESLGKVNPKPNIAIVSGLYELFAANAPIRASLQGLHSVMSPGSFLVYTNQPWHPQVEVIARVLINREKKPWIMRRRTQEEMDDLVDSAGFKKIGMEIDEWGIFTVSLAQRV